MDTSHTPGPGFPDPFQSIPPASGPKTTVRQRMRAWATTARKAVIADLAIHSMTYVGVLLAVVVIYAFYANGYFGEVVRTPNLRPLVFIATPTVFFALAWVLRTRTGIPKSAVAVELIGALFVPVMLSAAFRDGSSFPPDVNGPARWSVYGAVGLVTALFYGFRARSRPLYRYLTIPVVWVAVGALGLYIEPALAGADAAPTARDGISAFQLVLVAVAIALTPVAAARVPERLRRAIVTPAVRLGAAALPVLAFLMSAFARSDAVARGAADPGLGDFGGALALSFGAASVAFWSVRQASWAWTDLGSRLRRDIPVVLAVLSHATGAAAVSVGAASGIGTRWIGPVLVAWAAALALSDRTEPSRITRWTITGAGTIGLILSLGDPWSTIAAWVPAAGFAAASATGRRPLAPAVDLPAPFIRPVLWTTVLVTVGNGLGRAGWPDATPWLIATAAVALAALRVVRSPALRDLAGVPAWLAAGAAPASWLLALAMAANVTDGDLLAGAGVLAMSGTAALIAIAPWLVRLTAAAVAFTGSTFLVAEVVAATAADAAVLRSSWAAVAGLTLLARSMVRPRSDSALLHSAFGHAGVLTALAVAVPFERAVLIGLAAVVAAHAAESWAAPRNRSAAAERLAAEWAVVPPIVVAVGMPALAVLAGRVIPFLAAERSATGLALTAAAWITLSLARMVPTPFARRLYTASAVGTAAVAVAVTVPSIVATAATASSCSMLLLVVAISTRRPAFTVGTWSMAVASILLWGDVLGLAARDRHIVLAACAAVLAIVPVSVMARRGRPGGIPDPWLQPAFAIGTLLVPAALAFAMVDGRFVGMLMAAAAVLYAFIGYATRAGAAAIPATASAAVAYASFLEGAWSPYESPIRLLPFAAAAVLATALLPGRRGWRVLSDPAPGVLGTGLAVMALAVATAGRADLAAAFAGSAIVLGIARTVRPERWWTLAASAGFAAATSLAADPWAAIGAAGHAVAFGVLASVMRDRLLGRLAAWYATGLGAVAVGEMLGWGAAPVPPTLVTLALCAGAASAIGVGFVCTQRAERAAELWTGPAIGAGSSAAALLMATATARLETPAAADVVGATLAGIAVCWAIVATARRLPWAAIVAGAFASLSAVTFALASGHDPVVTVSSLLGLGAILLLGATAARDRDFELGLVWVPTLTLVGHGALAAATGAGFAAWPTTTSRFAAVAAALAVEAAAAAVLAHRRQDDGYALTTAILTAASFAAASAWIDPPLLPLATVTSALTAVIAGAAWAADRRGSRVWVIPSLSLAQAGAFTVAALTAAIGTAAAWGPVTLVLATETLTIATIAARTRRTDMVLLAGLAASATIGAALAWVEAPLETLAPAGLGIGLAAAAIATRMHASSPLWSPAGHLVASFGHVLAIAGATGFDGSARLLLVAAPLFVIAGHLGANAESAAEGVPMRELSALSASAAMLLSAVGIAEPRITVPVLGCIGLATAAIISVRRSAVWAAPLGVIAITSATAALLIPLSGPVPIERGLVAAAAAFIGADLAVVGVVRRQLLAVEAALATWLGAALLGMSAQAPVDSHATVVPIAVTLLAIISVERKRQRDGGGTLPTALRVAEWTLMVVPMTLAGADGISDLRYLGLLLIEGIALAGWGIVSEVRRRAFAGITGVFAAAAMFASIPVLEGTRGGISGGTWLVIGAVAAVVLIGLGSTLERYRARIGAAMGRISSIVEDWE